MKREIKIKDGLSAISDGIGKARVAMDGLLDGYFYMREEGVHEDNAALLVAAYGRASTLAYIAHDYLCNVQRELDGLREELKTEGGVRYDGPDK